MKAKGKEEFMKNGVNNLRMNLIKFTRSKLGLLLVTLLFVTSFIFTFTNKIYALTFEDGQEVVITVTDGIALNYTFKGTYSNGTFKDITKTNEMKVDGYTMKGNNFFDVITNAADCAQNAKSSTKAIQMLKDIMEKIIANNEATSNTFNGRYKYTSSTRNTVSDKYGSMTYIERDKTGKAKWNMYSTSYGGRTQNIVIDVTNICYHEDGIWPSQRIRYNDRLLTEYKDEEIMNILLNIDDACDYISTQIIATKSDEDKNTTHDNEVGIIAVGDSYTAELESDATEIDIVVKGDDGKEVCRFYFADVVGQNGYKERKYNNSNTTSCKLTYKNNTYSLTSKNNPKNAENSKNFYYLVEGETRKTFDTYSKLLDDASKNKTQTLTKRIFVAMPDDTLKNIIIYTASSANDSTAALKKIVTLSIDLINEKFDNVGTQVISNGWIFEVYNGSVIVAYKQNEKDIINNGWYYDFGTLKRMYVKGDKYADIFVAVKKGASSQFVYSYPQLTDRVFCLIRKNNKFNNKGKGYSFEDIKSEFALSLNNDNDQLFGVTCSLKVDEGQGAGSTSSLKLNPSNVNTDGSEPSGVDYPSDIPLNELLRLIDEYDKKINSPQTEITVDLGADLGAGKERIKESFKKDIIKYGRIILIFLVLLSIIYTGILAIMSGTDVQSRVLIKTRIKNILIGCAIFAAVIPLFTLVIGFAQDSLESLGEVADNYVGPTFYATITRYQTGWLVNFIGGIIDIVTGLLNWLIDNVMALSMTPNQSTNIMQLIYSVTDNVGNVSSLKPFSANEWVLYLEGYRLLSTITICLIAIAGVKTTAEIIINAGNYEKMVEVKETAKRTFFAIIGVILTPYVFRLLLLIFNYMVSLLPIDGDSATFDINFEAAGFVGSVANFTFATTRLRIYIAFLVRKVMLVIMLLASPVILGMWTIDKKFRGFSLWIGETFANAIMQFSYAMVFLVVILISYEGQNPFVTLILVTLIPKLASFFSKSFQGFAQRWGSIGSENMANEVVNFMKKRANGAKRVVKKTGGTFMKASKFFDKDGITKTGRAVNNIGAIMSGNFLSVRSRKEMMESRSRVAAKEYNQDAKALKAREDEMNPWINSNPDVEKYYKEKMKEIKNGNLDSHEKSKVMNMTGSGYDQVNDYIDQYQRTEQAKQAYQGYVNMAKNYVDSNEGGLVSKIGHKALEHMDDAPDAARAAVRFISMGPLSSIQTLTEGRASREALGYKLNQTRDEAMKAGINTDDINISEIVDKIVKMRQDLMHNDSINNTSTDGKKIVLNEDLGASTILKLSELAKQDTSKSEAKQKAINQMMAIAMDYHIKATNNPSFDLIDSIQETNDDYKTSMTKEQNALTEALKAAGEEMDKKTKKTDDSSFNYEDEVQSKADELNDQMDASKNRMVAEYKKKLEEHENAKTALEEAQQKVLNVDKTDFNNNEDAKKEKRKAQAQLLVAKLQEEQAKKEKNREFEKLSKEDLEGEFNQQDKLDEMLLGDKAHRGGADVKVTDNFQASGVVKSNTSEIHKQHTTH